MQVLACQPSRVGTSHNLVNPFLARETYQTFFQSRFAQIAIERHQIELIVYDPIMEEIVQWIN
jgi:XisH protein